MTCSSEPDLNKKPQPNKLGLLLLFALGLVLLVLEGLVSLEGD